MTWRTCTRRYQRGHSAVQHDSLARSIPDDDSAKWANESKHAIPVMHANQKDDNVGQSDSEVTILVQIVDGK